MHSQLLFCPGEQVYIFSTLQCSGSLCFWAPWIRVRNYLVFVIFLDPSIKKQKLVKTLISAVYWFHNDFLSLKTDGNVPTKSNKQTKLEKEIIFCWHLGSHWRKEQDPESDPDPSIKWTDPRVYSSLTVSYRSDPTPWLYCSVVDRHLFDGDPGPTFHFDAVGPIRTLLENQTNVFTFVQKSSSLHCFIFLVSVVTVTGIIFNILYSTCCILKCFGTSNVLFIFTFDWNRSGSTALLWWIICCFEDH